MARLAAVAACITILTGLRTVSGVSIARSCDDSGD